jgi:hypothetical protein
VSDAQPTSGNDRAAAYRRFEFGEARATLSNSGAQFAQLQHVLRLASHRRRIGHQFARLIQRFLDFRLLLANRTNLHAIVSQLTLFESSTLRSYFVFSANFRLLELIGVTSAFAFSQTSLNLNVQVKNEL